MRHVIVPGIDGSEPDHWQSAWERSLGAEAVRIAPASWSHPDLADWVRALDAAVTEPSVLVAHSLGCLTTASWLIGDGGSGAAGRVLGAFLVAPPDPAGPRFPVTAPTFVAPPGPLGVPAIVVMASDDPYGDAAWAAGLAATWGAGFVDAGPLGHINVASGIGAWAEGRNLLTAFEAGLGPGPRPAAG